MQKKFTSTIFVAAFAVFSFFHSFGQCGGVQYNFATGTSGFIGGGSGATFSASGEKLQYSDVINGTGTVTLKTPTLTLPNNATLIDFGYTYAHGTRASITSATVAVRYVNALSQIVTLSAQSFINSALVCTSISKPADMIAAGANANSYELIFTFTVTGNGSHGNANTFTIDNYSTTSTAAAIILPVKFSSVDAKTINSSVLLKWNVGSEENVNGYEVESSGDGQKFSKIGFVEATGSSSYSFVDNKLSSINYYRIKSVDIDGKYGYSTVVMVKGGSSTIILKAFPSPFTNKISIQHSTANANSLITINSEDGRIVKSVIPAIGTQQTDIDFSTAKSGLYLVRYRDGSGQVETLKIMKQ